MSVFIPSEIVLDGMTDITTYGNNELSFIQILQLVQADPRYKGSIDRVTVSHKTRLLNQYTFYITCGDGTMTYLLQEDVKNNQVIILMYKFTPKPTPPNPIVD